MLVLLQPNSRDHLPIKRQTDRSHLVSALSQQTITIDGRAFFFPKGKGMFSSMVILTLQRKVLVRRFHPPPSVILVFFLQLVTVGEETARNFNDTSGFGVALQTDQVHACQPRRERGPGQTTRPSSKCTRNVCLLAVRSRRLLPGGPSSHPCSQYRSWITGGPELSTGRAASPFL